MVSARCFLVIRINYYLTKAMYKEVFPDTTHTETHGEDTIAEKIRVWEWRIDNL